MASPNTTSSSTAPPPLRRGFAVVDVETSGLDPVRHRVIEVAVTQLTSAGRIEREWSSLVRVPGGTGPVHIHGLTTDDLRDAPTFAELVDELCGLLDGRILVAHNAAFDWAFLAAEAARAQAELPVSERLCTVHLARSLDLPTSNLRLGTLAEHWSIPVDTAHRAPDDVRVLVDVLRHCLERAGQRGIAMPLEECSPMPGFWRVRLTLTRWRRTARQRWRRVRRSRGRSDRSHSGPKLSG